MSGLRIRLPLCFTPFAMLMFVPGCMPAAPEPIVQGSVSPTVASQLQGRKRSSHGNKFEVPYEFKGAEFTANWELGNTLKKSSQMQMRVPADWSFDELQQALELVLHDYDTKPWYGQIDETVLGLAREAHADPRSDRASGIAPDTTYRVGVKVSQHTKEWFLEIKVQILDEDGNALGI